MASNWAEEVDRHLEQHAIAVAFMWDFSALCSLAHNPWSSLNCRHRHCHCSCGHCQSTPVVLFQCFQHPSHLHSLYPAFFNSSPHILYIVPSPGHSSYCPYCTCTCHSHYASPKPPFMLHPPFLTCPPVLHPGFLGKPGGSHVKGRGADVVVGIGPGWAVR